MINRAFSPQRCLLAIPRPRPMAWVSDGGAPSVLSFAATKVQRLNTWHPCLILSNRTVSVINKISLYIGACSLSVLLGAAAPNETAFHFRLSPGPRLVGTRADRSGAVRSRPRSLAAELTLQGFIHRSAQPFLPAQHLRMGSLPGVRGPVLGDTHRLRGYKRHGERQRAAQPRATLRPAQGRPVCGDR